MVLKVVSGTEHSKEVIFGHSISAAQVWLGGPCVVSDCVHLWDLVLVRSRYLHYIICCWVSPSNQHFNKWSRQSCIVCCVGPYNWTIPYPPIEEQGFTIPLKNSCPKPDPLKSSC